MAEDQRPSEEELRAALDAIGVADILVNALSAAASIRFRRVSPEARDLEQVRLAIESLRALDPVLREVGSTSRSCAISSRRARISSSHMRRGSRAKAAVEPKRPRRL